ncbi:type VI secretion system protein [Achromobacter spanius]|uniref:type VI secretion system protein n=1 Tax=Achromobacter TaxID=222 RepID=UPI001E43216F|nr:MULTISPECIES: type VI secretion system protein [Achromobacter]MCD0500119.1 type VI secretion system protein [Achromobacter sp. MY14]MCW3154009.1 type VI secretion system protein [Achromobacter spanius]
MIKKLLVAIAWLLGLLLLALACWVLGLYLGWPLWRSIALFLGVLIGLVLLRWLRGLWLAWRLRRRLARPVGSTTVSTERLDMDWRAGLSALKQSRLSRFGSPLYVLPWYMVLGPDDAARTELLRRAAGSAPVQGRSDDPAELQWWLLRNGVVLDPTAAMGQEHKVPDSPNWRRLLHWMMRTRRREPLNGLILAFNAAWLSNGADADLNETGQGLRKRLDELTRIYDARIPVYVVLTDCQLLPGFAAWAKSLGPDLTNQAMGFLNPTPTASVGQFINDAFNNIVHRMFDLRVLQGVRGRPEPDVFGLPERLVPLARQLAKVMRPAFQATPYAETPLMQGLFLTGQPAGSDRSQADWFSAGLFNHALPAQRHAWRPVERWRHWRRLLRHAAVVAWLGLCVGVGSLLVHASNTAQDELRAAAAGTSDTPDFSGPMSTDLHALQDERSAIHTLLKRPPWQRHWMPFQRRVNQVERRMMDHYTREFHREVIAANLDPLLISSLPQLAKGNNDMLLAAWAQTLVRRINLIDAALAGRSVYALPAPGSELPLLLASVHQTLRDSMDAILLGDMYRDYLTWQDNQPLLDDERRALRQVLAGLNLTNRPIPWLYSWVDLQGTIKPVRLTDFWNIPDKPNLPFIPAGLTPEGERAAIGFLDELGRATDNSKEWSARRSEFQQHYQSDGLDAWYQFTQIFPRVPDLLADGTARRAVLSSLLTPDDPYQRLIHMLAAVGERLPEASRPDWIVQAGRLDALDGLAQSDKGDTAASALQKIGVVQRFGGEVIKNLPQGGSLGQGISRLRNEGSSLQLLQAYRQGVHDTIVPLQQGDGTAMKAAIEIWSFGHDPNVKSVPLVNARTAIGTLREQQGTAGPRTSVIWDVAEGPMNFVLDYAGRNAGCRLQQQWENTVLSAIQGVTDGELANQLLYGDRGQVKAFLDGDIKNFVDHDSVRYEARTAMDSKIPLNGQFYAFASMTQLRQVTLATQQLHSKRSSDEVQALTQQQGELEKQITKLESTTGTVTLNTVPPQTNADARALPESVNLTLQCASGAITLENLNFPNSAVFPWSLATCGDTTLRIRYSDFELTRQWTGARGFIDFLKEFASGGHRYTPADFPDQKTLLSVADVQWIVVTYRQQGQAPLQTAFAEADRLAAQLQEIKTRLAELQPGTAPGSSMPVPAPASPVPQRIVSYCMGPVNSVDLYMPAPEAAPEAKPAPAAKPPAVKRAPTPAPAKAASSARGPYAVQVGIFSHPESVRATLKKNGYTVQESDITLRGEKYRKIWIDGYATREAAQAAAAKIGALLKLKPEVLRQDAER